MKALRRLLVGAFACLAAGASARTAYVSTGTRLVALDLTSGRVLGSQGGSGLLASIALSADGRRLEVASQEVRAQDRIREFDTAGLREARAIEVGARLKTIAPSPDGRRLYAIANHLITVVDAATGRASTTLPRGFDQPATAVSKDGRVFIAEGLGRDIAILAPGSATLTEFRGVARSLGGIAVSRDGRRLYLTDQDADVLIVIDAASGARLRTIPVCRGPSGVVLNTAETSAFVACAGYDFLDSEAKRAKETGGLAIVDLTRGRSRRTVATGGDFLKLAITPDGGRVVLGDGRSGRLWLIHPETGAIAKRLHVDGRAIVALAVGP